MNLTKTLTSPAFTLLAMIVTSVGILAAEPKPRPALASSAQVPARTVSKVDEANALCLQLIRDPTNATVIGRLEELGDAVVKPMLAQLNGMTSYWRSSEYLDNYVIRKSLTAIDSRPNAAGVVTTTISVPRMTPGEMAIVFMATRLSQLGTIEALPLLQAALAANESIRVHARPPMDAAIARLSAQASTGRRPPPPSPSPSPSTATTPSPQPASPAKPVALDRAPNGLTAPSTVPTQPAPTPPRSDAWLSGTWNGDGREATGSFTIRLTILRKDQLVGADVGYPSLNCSAKWTRQSGSERVVFFRSQVIQGNCINSWIRLEWMADGQARVSGHRSLADTETGSNPLFTGTIRKN